MLYTMSYDSPVGRLLLGEREGALAGLWIEGQKYFLGSEKEEIRESKDSVILRETTQWLDNYFQGEKPPVSQLKLAPSGSEFRKAVWKLLCDIPYGEVTTYKEIAQKVAPILGLSKMSAQAVGGAVSHNPVSIIIPCHRVVGANGSLTGYAGGLEKKIALLTLEGVEMKHFFVPGKGTAL
ncbi:MAG: methylated-DNA--[protein]-cysteine S-methyltransferase [Lachnospiraceae bacterium]|nr:methylated-DNA--[protein]-cysteine S-methyltransferase [Lachnospiraceae bacterium]